jgi:hypothetical protein
MAFEIATWYDNWNSTGLANLLNGIVPLNLASRYNMAFGEFVPLPNSGGAYTVALNQPYASQVVSQIRTQARGVLIYAGVGDTGLAATVQDNQQNNNRSTANIVAYLLAQGLNGITIDAESDGMQYVTTLVAQLSPSFRQNGLGIAVSVPWPGNGPVGLYGDNAVTAFNNYVDALELQDYSSADTPSDVPIWTSAGVKASILMGGVCTENSNVQTSLPDTAAWTQYAMQNGLRGMFSWRLDNDHCKGSGEDQDPTFTGAQTIYDTVYNQAGSRGKAATG